MDMTVESIQYVIESTENIAGEANQFLEYFQDQIPALIRFGINIVLAILLFIIGRIVIKCLCRVVKKYLKKSNVDPGVAQFLNSFVRVALYVLLVFLIAQVVGVESSSAAALLASAGVAIGLAMQGSLSNLAGGVLILLLKPFVVGDYIIAHNGNNEGTVKEISIFYTKLFATDNRSIIIPNGMLSNSSITNVAKQAERQLDIKLTLSYQSEIPKAKELVEKLLLDTPEVMTEKGVKVFVDELATSGVILGIQGWVKTEFYEKTRTEILEKIKEVFEKEKILLQS